MELTERQKRLIKSLADSKNTATGKALSASTGFSLRTIQSEMAILRKEGIISSDTEGYHLINEEVISTSAEIRNYALIKRLLSVASSHDLYDLCDDFYVSETTMRQRLKEVNEFLKDENLYVDIHGTQVSLKGTELNKRQLIRKLIYKDASSRTDLQSFFPDIDVTKLGELVHSSLSNSGYYIQNPYANAVLLSIIICLYRILNGIHTPDSYSYDAAANEYKLAKCIAKRFREHYTHELFESDISYIANLFQGQIVEQSHIRGELNTDSIFENEIGDLLLQVFSDYSVNLDYAPYLHTIALHIHELIRRGQANNFVISNSYQSMRENCPYIYDIAVHFARKLEQKYGIGIPDDEIGFLAVHIGLIIRQEKQNKSNVRILLHAPDYHGISERIIAKLKAGYEDSIEIIRWDTCSGQMPSRSVDLIITTEHLDLIGRDILEITPFYDMVDRANVDAAVSKCLKDAKRRKEYQALMDCFSPELFFIRDDIHTTDEAIEYLGQKMIDYGITEKGYIESVKTREHLSPTSFFDTFAIPHSIEMNANKTMFAILINRNGISWNQTKVKLCIMIAIKKEDLRDFSNIYDGVVHVLCDSGRFNELILSKNIQEFTESFR